MESAENLHRWHADERSGFKRAEDILEKLLTVPLDPCNPHAGEFDLYYFVQMARGKESRKSILFCAGGPGEFVRTTGAERNNSYVYSLHQCGYNIVYFHLRGTGLSQLPPGNEYDKYLRSKFAIKDMEAVRRDYLGMGADGDPVQWDAIVGWSFGTILAQMYASRYPKLVKRIILISPLSRHLFKEEFNQKKAASDDYYKESLRIYEVTLKQIFSSAPKEFEDLIDDQNKMEWITRKLFDFSSGLLSNTERAFGSIPAVVDQYSLLEESKFPEGKKYSRQFYQSLRDLRRVGAQPLDKSGVTGEQLSIAKILRDELESNVAPQNPKAGKRERGQGAHRAYYCFGIQDGLNWSFLRERFDRGKSIDLSVKGISGEMEPQGTSRSTVRPLDKVRIDGDLKMQPWDPKDYPHNVPTLILNGEYDPVTAGGQADRYFDSAIEHSRTLIEFPRTGHQVAIGVLPVADTPLLSGSVEVSLPELGPGELVETTGFSTGVEFNENLRVELEGPSYVKIRGCGILKNSEATSNQDEGTTIVALISAPTDRAEEILASEWKLKSPLFWGLVRFKELVKQKGQQVIFGELVGGQRNLDKAYKIRPLCRPNDKNPIELVGFNLKGGSGADLWFQNKGTKKVDPEISQWILENEESRFTFHVNPEDKIAPAEIKLVEAQVNGLTMDPVENLAIEPPEELNGKLKACFDLRQDSEKMWFTVWNRETENTKRHRLDKPWTIASPVFEATLNFHDQGEIEPGSIKRVSGEITRVKWKRYLSVEPPSGWDPNLQILSYSIRAGNSLSLIFKNTGTEAVAATTSRWKYRMIGDPNLTPPNGALECLMFSFLVLDPSQFRNPADNRALKLTIDQFKKISPLRIRPQFRIKPMVKSFRKQSRKLTQPVN